MSSTIYVQFYVFDEKHFAVPIETMEPTVQLTLWAPTMALISEISKHQVIYSVKREWLEEIPGSPKWLFKKEPDTSKALPNNEHTIIVLLTEMSQLHRKSVYHNLVLPREIGRKPLRVIKSRGKRNVDMELRYNRPVIMIGTEDIMGLFEERNEGEIEKQRYKYSLNLDARFKFWDSGIWHRYVPIVGRDGAFDFDTRVKDVYDKMCGWYNDGLYSTFVALENIEFQTRLMLNSVIAEVGHHGHQERVTPFKFHSEAQMERRCEEILQELDDEKHSDKTKLLDTLQWDLLLVDDQAERPLSHFKSEPEIKVASKADIIKKLLNPQNAPPIFNVAFTKAGSKAQLKVPEETRPQRELIPKKPTGFIAEAFDMLKQKTYDVILLDYLLGDGMPERNGREYGYDFLSKLSDLFDANNVSTKEKLPHKGPLGRFWIFPISSFPFAFADKLRQLGMDGYSTYWHLAGGGDPVCTPALFKYNFLNFIKQQISECYLNKASRVNMVRKFSHLGQTDLWQRSLLKHIERLELKKEVLEYDNKFSSLFAAKMLELKGKYPQSNNEVEDIKNLVANISTASFNSYKAFLGQITDPVLNTLLAERGNQYFDAETRFIQQVKEHQGSEEFVFERKALRWLPDEVSQLKSIKTLHLSHNNLTILPKTITKLDSLEELNLSNNKFSEIPSWLLEEMPHLKTINLEGNHGLPSEIQGVRSTSELQMLRLQNNTARSGAGPIHVSIIYSNKDADGFEALRLYLDQMSDHFTYELPLPGKDHKNEWSKIIRKSKLCVAFISADFIKDCNDLLSIAADNNLLIIPINWRDYSALKKDHPVLKDRKFLPDLPIKGKDNLDMHLNNIVQNLKSIAAHPAP